jgi:hypothetical protein
VNYSISHSIFFPARALAFAVLSILMTGLASCTQPADYSSEIRVLDSLHQVVKAEYEDLDHFPRPENDTIQAHLKYVMDNFVGQMKADIALKLSEYSLNRQINEQLRIQRDTLLKQGDVITSRCMMLKQALTEKATHDADHNELNPEYTGNAFANEKKLAGDWIGKSKNWKNAVNDLHNKIDKQMPVIQHWLDSIPQRTK